MFETKDQRLNLIFVVLVVLVHGLMMLLPSVNQEFVFTDGARFFIDHNPVLLEHYFTYQANTLGIPWLASLVARLLPGLDMLVVVRLLSVSGLVLLNWSVSRRAHCIWTACAASFKPACLDLFRKGDRRFSAGCPGDLRDFTCPRCG
jgi:hypothetical protein